jgi:hypothetical protein
MRISSSAQANLFKKFRKDDIIIGGTKLDKGTTTEVQANSNNERTNQLLERLILAVESGGDVYLDGNKVGKSLALSTSRLG